MNKTTIAYYILDALNDKLAINAAYKRKIDADIALEKHKKECIFGNKSDFLVQPAVCDDTGYIYTVSTERFGAYYDAYLNIVTGHLEVAKSTATWRHAFESSSETDKKTDFDGKDQISISYYDERLMEDVVVYINRHPII